MMSTPPSILDINIMTSGWRRIPRLKARLEKAAQTTLVSLPQSLQFSCAMTVLLTGNEAVRRLNRDFRGADKPTNVLSFPQFEPRKLPKKGKGKDPVYLGDIAMAYQYIVGEASKDNKMLINHVIHLLIHGILHLFGYHHGSDTEAARMEHLEKRIMARLDLPDPYVPRMAAARKK